MQLKINDDWAIKTDEHNYVIQSRSVAKTGKHVGEESWSNASYHGSMESALRELVRLDIRKADLVDLRSIVGRVDELDRSIARALKTCG